MNRPYYYQSVYSCSSFPVEPYQQLYPFQNGTSQIFDPTTLYDAEIIAGTDYAYFERVAYIDSSGNSYPAETFGSLLSGLTGAELSGTGNFIGYEGPGTFERENPTVYRIHFDNYSESEVTVIVRITNLNDNTYADWHTLIVNPDLRFVNQQYEADTLLHYYSKDVTPGFINANFPCSHPGYGGCPPTDVTFNIEILQGNEYGNIKNELTDEISSSFTGITYSELYLFTYYANGLQPDSTATVRIRHSSSDAEMIPQEFSFIIKRNTIPPPSEGGSIYVQMDKEEVMPGDTVNINLLWINEVEDTVEFSEFQRFQVDIAEGQQYGTIVDLETGQEGDSFSDIGSQLMVITDEGIQEDLVKVFLVAQADLMIWTIPVTINNQRKTKQKENQQIVDKADDEGGITPDIIIIGDHLVGVGEITITKEHTILLGETKYYGVKKKVENGTVTEIKIEEIKVGQDSTPVFPSLSGGWSWIQQSSIWSERPINIQTEGQSPIFYDKFYAQVFYSGTTKPIIHDLPEGMIRIIGRYLGKTPDNKVKLFTTQYQSSFTDTLEIQVIRPNKLGDDILSITGPTKVDYVDTTYNNIDSLVIDIAGELGIPPQFLMGIVQQESPNGLGYRYEPFADMMTVQKKFDTTHRYWIESETELGDPTIPHHNNIKDARGPLDNYPGFITVWDIFNEKNEGKNKMYSLSVYDHMKEDYWLPYKKNHFKSLTDGGLDSLAAEDSSKILADTSYIKFLRDSIGGKGMYGTPAQTRIAASYGFMQLTYFSGVKSYKDKGYNYPDNDPNFLPEYIMIPPINIVFGSKHFLGKLRDKLGPVVYPNEDTWPIAQAFELSYWKAFLSYNGGREKEYPNWVFSHVKNNLPKKN